VHLIIDNMSDLAEIDGVDDLVVSVFFISVKILGLTTMALAESAEFKPPNGNTYQSNGRKESRWAEHPSQANALPAGYSAL
jgi:hypothetical protein